MTETIRKSSNRLQGYDYSQPGAYFTTVCASNRQNLFGEIVSDRMELNDAGFFARQCWQEIPKHFLGVTLDEFVVMPNHVHGIIVINNETIVGKSVGVQHVEPLRNNEPRRISNFQHVIPGSLGAIVRGFKSAVTRWFHVNTRIKTVWQRNFYDHVVRDDPELSRIRLYIRQNPAKWEFDRLNQQFSSRVGEPENPYCLETWMV
ncbi:MAG: hypothetical protein ACD_39C00726G0004 [uncultured bacterium]|nr:MAG: hypothetical protein ACD_39C00726G0004 [uncultured bacterium]